MAFLTYHEHPKGVRLRLRPDLLSKDQEFNCRIRKWESCQNRCHIYDESCEVSRVILAVDLYHVVTVYKPEEPTHV